MLLLDETSGSGIASAKTVSPMEK